MNAHFNSKYATISYDPAEEFVRLEIHAFLNDEGIKELFTKVLHYFKTLDTTKILNDFRNFKGSSPKAQKWVSEHYYPAMREYGLTHIATVLSSSIFAEHTVHNVQKKLTEYFGYETFDDVEEAEEWLKHQDDAVWNDVSLEI